MRILLVEDDELLPAGLRDAFAQAGHAMDHVGAAEPALLALALGVHDVAVVDIGLPGMDGLSLVRQLRAAGNRVPVLMLTARDGLADRVQGLNEGADDYLVKPFALAELIARVQALMRRSLSATSSRLVVGALTLDVATREALLHDELLLLTTREWALLHLMVLAAPGVVAKRKLADSLGCWDHEITDNAIEVSVSRLRGKLADSGVTIRTVRGIGYRLDS